MEKKLRQVTDTIHQTVYLSELESEMMSTAYFYRLHDVYQSSTVYLTFPCNRTKRYEHSYGTMELAGEMFYSAVTNAETSVICSFFAQAEKYLGSIVEKLLAGSIRPSYCQGSHEKLGKCFNQVHKREVEKESKRVVRDALTGGDAAIEDIALNHYMPPFKQDVQKHRYLYQCVLEAVRIAALFHDVGHPPFSHILEAVLDELYKECKEDGTKWNPKKRRELLDSLKAFKEKGSSGCGSLLLGQTHPKSALHEQVGLQMISSAFDDVFQELLSQVANDRNLSTKEKSAIATYYVTVAEFCFAILTDKDAFFSSIHRIIDGSVDADRLDYVMRDSRNSGFGSGHIPHKRLLDSCKLIEAPGHPGYYVISYPAKMAMHIDELLVSRYKIYSQVNYHHRCYKTSLILQRIVKFLAQDYLRKEDGKGRIFCPGIADLWNCLQRTMNSKDLYIIQWNDSRLISHLYQTLTEVKSASRDAYQVTAEEFENITNMLEEFLLNRKHFHAVFKRQSDLSPILGNVFLQLRSELEEAGKHEGDKLANGENSDGELGSQDSLMRLEPTFLDNVIRSGDGDIIQKLFPSDPSMGVVMESVFAEYKRDGKIREYLFDENKKWADTGLPINDENKKGADTGILINEEFLRKIYLYDSGGNVEVYDTSNLETQIVSLQGNFLKFIAYIEPCENDLEVIDWIYGEIQERFRKALTVSLRDLF